MLVGVYMNDQFSIIYNNVGLYYPCTKYMYIIISLRLALSRVVILLRINIHIFALVVPTNHEWIDYIYYL